jgi:enoyl-CoA hydratase/carnithine racemase
MEACSSYFLPRLIGHSRAIHLTTTGLTYPPTSPLFGTLYSEVLPTPEATLSRALELAEDVAKNTSILASYLMREMMWRDAGSAEGQHLLDSRIIHGLFDGRENEEGIRSFFEKRSPNFKGTLEEDAPAYYPWWNRVDVQSRAQKAKESKL